MRKLISVLLIIVIVAAFAPAVSAQDGSTTDDAPAKSYKTYPIYVCTQYWPGPNSCARLVLPILWW